MQASSKLPKDRCPPDAMFGPLFSHHYSPPLPLIRSFYFPDKQVEVKTQGDTSQLRLVGAAPGKTQYFVCLPRCMRPPHNSAWIDKEEG